MVGRETYHEHDARWTAMDQYALPHLQPTTQPYDAALKFAESHAEKNGLPDIAVSPFQGQYLALQCKLINAKHILEVGTLGGYSTIWLASISPDVQVTSIEVNPHHAKVAEEAIANAGLSDRVKVLLGSAKEVIPKLNEEVQAGKREKWDFVFIDADKISNWFYLENSIPMIRKGGLVIVDNVVRKGTTADAERAKTDDSVKGSRMVIENAAKDERLDATMVQTVGDKNYDGFLMCMVR